MRDPLLARGVRKRSAKDASLGSHGTTLGIGGTGTRLGTRRFLMLVALLTMLFAEESLCLGAELAKLGVFRVVLFRPLDSSGEELMRLGFASLVPVGHRQEVEIMGSAARECVGFLKGLCGVFPVT